MILVEETEGQKRELGGAASFGSALQIASDNKQESPFSLDVQKEKAQLWQWLSFPICALLVVFSVPSMSFGLYKKSIQEVLSLESEEVQDIVSFALVGGYALCFIPGLLYDACGYKVTLISGGVMATSGSFLWYWLLRDGGEPGSPTWYGLGLALMLMCHGCRYQYVTGVCAILSIFPEHLISSVSGCMAVCAGLGHIILPLIWSWIFLPRDMTNPEEVNQDSGTLVSLKPVSSLFFFLSIFYACITISGLTIARWLKPQQSASVGSSLTGRLRKLRDPEAMAQVVLVVFTMAFVSAFMKSGVAEAAHHAGATPAEVAAVLGWMGIWGLVGGFSHGLSTDLVRAYTPAGQAAQELMFVTAISWGLLGYCLMIGGNVSWSVAACLIAFSHGALFALYPAAVRVIFPKAEVGFWLGSLTSLMGVTSWLYGRLGAALEWNSTMYVCGSAAALMTIFVFLAVACTRWGHPEMSMERQVSPASSILIASGIWPSSFPMSGSSGRQVSGQEYIL